MKENKKSDSGLFHFKAYLPSILFATFIGVSVLVDFQPGIDIMNNFIKFFVSMMKFIPAIFLLLGLFEVWINRKLIEKHLGEESGIKGYIWALILSTTITGGLHIAFPIAYTIYKKGASLRIVLAYISFATVCRIPMTLFELSFLGIKFTVIRLVVSIPIVIIFSKLLSDYLVAKKYKLKEN